LRVVHKQQLVEQVHVLKRDGVAIDCIRLGHARTASKWQHGPCCAASRAGPIDGEARIAAKRGRAAGRSEADTYRSSGRGRGSRPRSALRRELASTYRTPRAACGAKREHSPRSAEPAVRREPRADGVA
jgi:hypothetical protein